MNSLTDYRAPENGRRTFLYWIEALLLIAGLVFGGWFGYNWLASEADQIWSSYQLDASRQGQQATLRGFVQYTISGRIDDSEPREAVDMEPSRPALARQPEPGENIGRIEIPRLNISAIVRQGVDDKTLSRAVGHVPSTPLPGEAGNTGLAAHRDSYFRNLRDVNEGDLIRVVTPDGTLQYQVESTQIVMPSNVQVLNPTSKPSLTLVTCYPFNYIGHAPKRFIVRAVQLGAEEVHSAPASYHPRQPAKKRRARTSARRRS